jgi:WD40 repeat protein
MRFIFVLVLLASVTVLTGTAAESEKTTRLDLHGDEIPAGASARMGTLRFQPPGHDVALSPDGTILAAATPEKDGTRLHFMETSTGRILRKLDLANFHGTSGFRPTSLQFTPDGKSLVFHSWSNVTLVDVVTGKVGNPMDVKCRDEANALTSDGKWLAVQTLKTAYHAPVGVWETTTGKEVASLPGRGAQCRGLAFSRDGKRLLLWSIVPTNVSDNSMSWSNDSKVALACIDIQVRKIVGEITVGSSQHVTLCPDGETVAVEEPDHQGIRIRHLPTGAERCLIPVKQPRFAFAPDGKVLLAIDNEGQAALWDAAKGTKIRDLEGALANKDFWIVGISKDTKTIAVVDGGWHSAPLLVVWDGATGKRAARPPGHEGTVTCMSYAPDGTLLASGSVDKTVRLWNPKTGEHVRKLTVHSDAVTAVAISPDGKLLASSNKSGVTRLSNIADGELVAQFAGPAKGAKALVFSQDGKILFAGGDSPEVRAWELTEGKELVRLSTGDDGAVMAFAEGGDLAVTANGEPRAEDTAERLLVWHPLKKQALASIPIRNEPPGETGGAVRCDKAVFSMDGRLLGSSQISVYQGIRPSYGNAKLRIWERVTRQEIRTLAPTITTVLAFSPNGRLVASGGTGESGHLRVGYGSGIDVWDAVTGKKAGELPVSPECAIFSPDGTHLATGGRDHAILIWDAPTIQQPIEANVPSATQRDTWWKALGGDAKDAYKAIGEMLDAPEHVVVLLKERVPPERSADPDTVAKLVAQIDSETYGERVKAQAALEKMGEGAAHLIAQALERKVSLELRRRLEVVLSKCDATSTLRLQQHRAVATLEWIGTPAARTLLRSLADGAPRARLTMEARAALKRLEGARTQ